MWQFFDLISIYQTEGEAGHSHFWNVRIQSEIIQKHDACCLFIEAVCAVWECMHLKQAEKCLATSLSMIWSILLIPTDQVLLQQSISSTIVSHTVFKQHCLREGIFTRPSTEAACYTRACLH